MPGVNVSDELWSNKSVLVVDDSPLVRDDLTRIFESVGMRVVAEAANGVEALELYSQHQPDLVSLDLIMPEMDGVECYRRLKELNPQFNCLIVSWLGSEVRIVDSLAELLPADFVLPKPLAASELELRLRKLFEQDTQVLLQPASAETPKLAS